MVGWSKTAESKIATYQVRFGYFELPICFLGENPKLHNKTCTNKKTFINYSTVLMKYYIIGLIRFHVMQNVFVLN